MALPAPLPVLDNKSRIIIPHAFILILMALYSIILKNSSSKLPNIQRKQFNKLENYHFYGFCVCLKMPLRGYVFVFVFSLFVKYQRYYSVFPTILKRIDVICDSDRNRFAIIF